MELFTFRVSLLKQWSDSITFRIQIISSSTRDLSWMRLKMKLFRITWSWFRIRFYWFVSHEDFLGEIAFFRFKNFDFFLRSDWVDQSKLMGIHSHEAVFINIQPLAIKPVELMKQVLNISWYQHFFVGKRASVVLFLSNEIGLLIGR